MTTLLRSLTCAIVLGLVTVHAQAPSIRYASITVDATSGGVPLTASLLAGPEPIAGCSGRLETAAVRYRFDGTAPTSSEGILLEALDVITIPRVEIARSIRFIRTTGTSGVLKIHCWTLA